MSWKSRKDGKHYKTRSYGLYGPPRYKKYSDIVSLQSAAEARTSAIRLLSEFDNTQERSKKVRVKRVAVEAANRAQVGARRIEYSDEARKKYAEVEKIYREASSKMVLQDKKKHINAVALRTAQERIEQVLKTKDDSWQRGHLRINGKDYFFTTEGWYPNCVSDVKEEYLYDRSHGLFKRSQRSFAEQRAKEANEKDAKQFLGVEINASNHVKTFKLDSSWNNDGTDYITAELYEL
jgi:hypothetical protein